MPKVYTYKTQARRKTTEPYRCIRCREDILPGQERYEWSFRYGGTYRQHVSCGYPKRSQLTQSKMGAVYDAIDEPWGDTQEEIATNLENAAEVVREVASEYEDAAEAFGGAGENQERAEALEAFADELGQAKDEVEGADKEDSETDEGFIERIYAFADDAAGNCPY